MKKISSTDEALMLFEECSIKHGKATENGDYKQGNKNHDIIIACILYLYDSQQLQLLEPFLEHQDVNVRLWAAFALLTVERTKAEKTELKEITKAFAGTCFYSFSDPASTASQWSGLQQKTSYQSAGKRYC